MPAIKGSYNCGTLILREHFSFYQSVLMYGSMETIQADSLWGDVIDANFMQTHSDAYVHHPWPLSMLGYELQIISHNSSILAETSYDQLLPSLIHRGCYKRNRRILVMLVRVYF